MSCRRFCGNNNQTEHSVATKQTNKIHFLTHTTLCVLLHCMMILSSIHVSPSFLYKLNSSFFFEITQIFIENLHFGIDLKSLTYRVCMNSKSTTLPRVTPVLFNLIFLLVSAMLSLIHHIDTVFILCRSSSKKNKTAFSLSHDSCSRSVFVPGQTHRPPIIICLHNIPIHPSSTDHHQRNKHTQSNTHKHKHFSNPPPHRVHAVAPPLHHGSRDRYAAAISDACA